jgi:hypothetical protein
MSHTRLWKTIQTMTPSSLANGPKYDTVKNLNIPSCVSQRRSASESERASSRSEVLQRWAVKTETVCSSETLVSTFKSTLRYNGLSCSLWVRSLPTVLTCLSALYQFLYAEHPCKDRRCMMGPTSAFVFGCPEWNLRPFVGFLGFSPQLLG